MTRPRLLTAIAAVGFLVVAASVPVAAGDKSAIAQGDLTWTGQWNSGKERPGRTSVFSVRDGRPGKDSRKGDRGWYRFSEKNDEFDQDLTLSVSCVRVNGDWAEFAGEITEATGNFNVGNVFLVSVVDLDSPQPNMLHIGMQSWDDDLDAACAAATDSAQYDRRGQYTGGTLDVYRR